MGYVTVGQGLLKDLLVAPEQHDDQFAEGEEGQLVLHWNLPEDAPVVWGLVDDFTNQTPGAWREGGVTHIPVQKNSPLIVAAIIIALAALIVYLVFFEPKYEILKKIADAIKAIGGPAVAVIIGAAILLLVMGGGDNQDTS